MLDIKHIREHLAWYQQGALNKRFKIDWDQLLSLDDQLRQQQLELETLQAERNRLSKMVSKASASERAALIAQVNVLKPKLDDLNQTTRQLKDQLTHLVMLAPQPARDDVPIGNDDQDNLPLHQWGDIPSFSFSPRDHLSLGESLKLIDVPRGVKLAGSRSYILTGLGARLEQAVLRLTTDVLHRKGYTQLSVPVLVKEDAMIGTGYFPNGRDQAYLVEQDQLALIGTAEVSLTALHTDEWLDAAQLPVKYFAQSTCFRREAGTYGKDTHGLYRVHQFQKVEQVVIAPADMAFSEALHAELLGNAEEIMQLLELPYRVVYVCTGDLGQGQVRKHDIEAWMPSRQAYGETHSCSTFHDYQARRLMIRYKDPQGNRQFCYTLNNTAIATPRVLIPLLEVHQQEDGSIRIPKALQPYLDGLEVIGPQS
jgi:seryl-tRNA synthetase